MKIDPSIIDEAINEMVHTINSFNLTEDEAIAAVMHLTAHITECRDITVNTPLGSLNFYVNVSNPLNEPIH